MIGLSRMISLAARGGVSIDNILDQLKSCGTCPSYAVRSAVNKDTSKGSSCPVAVGNALRNMHKEIQEIICECQKGNPVITNIQLLPTTKPTIGNPVNKEIKVKYYSPTTDLEECPNCHKKTLTRQGGCLQCIACGYSKCN